MKDAVPFGHLRSWAEREIWRTHSPLPAGVCRQALYEFCQEDLLVLLARDEEHFTRCTLGQLLPLGFAPEKFADCHWSQKSGRDCNLFVILLYYL